jgi:hypothetical protein
MLQLPINRQIMEKQIQVKRKLAVANESKIQIHYISIYKISDMKLTNNNTAGFLNKAI